MPKGEETIPDAWALEAAAQCQLSELYRAGFHQPAIAHALRAARTAGYAEAQTDIRKVLEDAAGVAERQARGASGLMRNTLLAMKHALRSGIETIDAGKHVGAAVKP